MSRDRIGRKNQALSDVRSGYINVQSMTGFPRWRLEHETEFLRDYDFGGSPWMPMFDWNDIVLEYFPGCKIFSYKTMANSAGYSDWRSFDRAVTRTGSAFHFFQDGPVRVTMVSSYNAGVRRLHRVMEKNTEQGRKAGFLNRWTMPSSGSIG